MSNFGDFHNFGQRVVEICGASGSVFQKPRTIFWEWLFFGKTSPFRDVFIHADHSAANKLTSSIFNLDTTFESNSQMGRVAKIYARHETTDLNAEELFCFGGLIAYCYIFGIRDLHRGNLIRTETHLQVVDVEVVLTKLILPHETLLLPFKETTFEKSAISNLFRSKDDIRAEHFTSILSGYLAMFEVILETLPVLLKVLENETRNISFPVRHIMRDTIQYLNWKTTNFDEPLCEEELEQLRRGDVPYFFKFVGDEKLFLYTSPNGNYESVTVPSAFKTGVDREARSPSELLNRVRIQNELMVPGALFLGKMLRPTSFTGILSPQAQAEVRFTDKEVYLTVPCGNFRAAL